LSREGTSILNELAQEAQYGGQQEIITLPGDVEANHLNYTNGKLKPVGQLRPLALKIYAGMPIFLTRNRDKAEDHVNGMRAIVERWDARTQSLWVITTTGHRVAVYHYTDPTFGICFYDIRPGWASTVLKFQGAELKHVTVWLNVPGVPGAAYTAMSRVSYGRDCLIGGNVNPLHFTPANWGTAAAN
jgi:ATP-dependent exoDNAse (exonuclease V) alpha subunit